MSTRANICIKLNDENRNEKLSKFRGCVVNPNGAAYLTIYNHNDGYPSGLGMELKDNFNTYEDALDLILGGDTSYVEGKEVGYYYYRNEAWQNVKPIVSNTIEKDYSVDYTYVFEDDKWYLLSEDGNLEDF